jgi:Glycosyl hydrolases family 11.
MKNLFKLFWIILLVAIIGFLMSACEKDDDEKGKNDDFDYDNKTWVDPATQTTQLTGGTKLLSYTEGKSIKLSGTPYEYETWDYSWDTNSGFGAGTNKFTWYGANQGGGGAFKAEWQTYFLARLGFYWNHGGKYTQYKNIYIDYNFKRSNNASAKGGFTGIYGWFRSPSASNTNEKLIEYYIVDDWFYDVQMDLTQIGSYYNGVKYGEELGSFQVDGAVYKIYKNPRINEPAIDGTTTFTQIFSVRQGRRTYGTISVTEHFNAWSKYIKLDDIYEAKFLVEVFGGNGYLDLTYLYLSQETKQRSWIAAGTPPVDYGSGGETGGTGETVKGSFSAYAGNSYNSLSSSVNYQVVDLPSESKTNVLKVVNPGEWAVALYDLSSYKGQNKTFSFSAQVKRVGAAGTLNWQVNNSDYPSVGTPINNAAAGTWHSMSGTWTGTPSDDSPKFYLSTHENNSGSTTYYISNFTITVTP